MRKDRKIWLSDEQVERIEALLQAQWGTMKRKPPRRPLDELILTILSQNTSDRNSGRAFRSLRQRWRGWEGVLKASRREVEDVIREGGLAHIKAGRIQTILEEISRERGSLDLDILASLFNQGVRDYLMRFKGVGPKTVACVLLFSLNRPAFPVDTHVFRVLGRVTGVDRKMNPARMQEELEKVVPPDCMYSLHLHLVRHGRLICRPRDPLCEECNLLPLCAYGKQLIPSRSRVLAGSL